MPLINIHLIEGYFSDQQAVELLEQAAGLYSEVLKSPVERIRAFITPHAPSHSFVAGDRVSNNRLHAPYFEFIVLDGRPLEERQALLKGFAQLISQILKVELKLVRGHCRRVSPEEWGIGDTPASDLRKAEIEARKEAQNISCEQAWKENNAGE
jgi:4-oxalocrotonate tautomerase